MLNKITIPNFTIIGWKDIQQKTIENFDKLIEFI